VAARHGVGARLARLLVDSVVRLGAQRAPLAGLEVRDRAVGRRPAERTHRVVGLVEQGERDAEGAVRRLGAGHRLEEQVHRRAAAREVERRGGVGEHARLHRVASSRWRSSSSISSSAATVAGASVAGLMPITASPAP
jgi:hypothetical protein